MEISDDHLLQLGRLTNAATHLDFVATILATMLMRVEVPVGQVVFSGMPFQDKVRRLRALAHHQLDGIAPEVRTDLEAWAVAASRLAEERNRAAHDPLLPFEDDPGTAPREPARWRSKIKGDRLVTEFAHVTAEDLRSLADRLEQHCEAGFTIPLADVPGFKLRAPEADQPNQSDG
jgi:hypothetical protein